MCYIIIIIAIPSEHLLHIRHGVKHFVDTLPCDAHKDCGVIILNGLNGKLRLEEVKKLDEEVAEPRFQSTSFLL